MDVKLRLDGMKSNFEMGSLDNRSANEFENESIFTLEEESRKEGPALEHENRSISEGSSSHGYKNLRNGVYKSIKTVVLSNKLNLLMPFGPLAIMVHKMTGHQGWVFFLSLLGITPLAERLGYATEQLAFYTGATVGGLLNATFGNATELIISIYALKRGLLRVVQLSLLGSILSNMLLVLGCAFFCGGLVIRNKQQKFDKASAVVNSGLLLMAVMGLLFPAVLHYTHTELHFGKSELALSRFSSCIMLVAYAAYLVFQLKGQRDPYLPITEEENQATDAVDHDNDSDEEPEISKWESIIWLSIMTAWISILSEYLVNAIQIPFCVVIGWIMGRTMDLNFQLFETATLFITVIVVAFFLQEGTSNYFKGLMLILCYLIVAASFFVHEDPSPEDDKKLRT